MNKPLEKILRSYARLGYATSVVSAPKDAITFDKMVIVYQDDQKEIRSLLLYNTQIEAVVSTF